EARPVSGEGAGAHLARGNGVEPCVHPLLDADPPAAWEYDAGVALLLEFADHADGVRPLDCSDMAAVPLAALLEAHRDVAVKAAVVALDDRRLAVRSLGHPDAPIAWAGGGRGVLRDV